MPAMLFTAFLPLQVEQTLRFFLAPLPGDLPARLLQFLALGRQRLLRAGAHAACLQLPGNVARAALGVVGECLDGASTAGEKRRAL